MPRWMRTLPGSALGLCLTLAIAVALDGAGSVAAAQPPSTPPPVGQQPPTPPQSDAGRPLRVFVDCTNVSCDTEYFRTEITFVDHVRDRRDADVHVLVTGDATGGGGREYTFAFIGLGRFDKVNQTLRAVSNATDTADDRRRAMVASLKLGLVRYVAETPAGRDVQVTYRAPVATSGATAPARDPWNFWVFNANLRGSANGEASQTSVSLSGGLSSNRVTQEWKVLTSVSASYSESDYTFVDGDTYTSMSRGFYGSALVVNSLGQHWGAGGQVWFTSSTYLNYDAAVRVAPAVEYNLFPYSESTRRQLTFNYGVGVSRVNYREKTLYGKDEESLVDHAFDVSLELRQPWGSTSTSVEFSQYLHDLGKNRLVVYGDMDVRLFKGFSLTAWGTVSRIRDQLNLPAGAATQEEVLVQQRQLATSYSYYVSMGITYRFGSIFNNVVNARFANVRQSLR
jgi:hypothetical protein